MTDMIDDLNAVHRATGQRRVDQADARTIVLSRRYDAPISDVWDAITDPARISRWLLPVTGDLRLGGRYQLEGNAGGEIIRCEPPRLLAVSWIFGEQAEGDMSEVEVRLSGDGDGTRFDLEHVATVDPGMWNEYGPGAVGIGWDLSLLGLAAHLRGESLGDPEALAATPEAQRFMTESSEAWGAALAATGAPDDDVKRVVANSTAFYVPAPEQG
jgi:uncharacterized protein YndB with AHSA1/START domain